MWKGDEPTRPLIFMELHRCWTLYCLAYVVLLWCSREPDFLQELVKTKLSWDPHRRSVIKCLDGAHDCHSKCYIKGVKLLSTSDSKLYLTGLEWVHFTLRVKLQTAFRRFTPTTTTFSDDVISFIYPIWLFAQRCWVIAGSHGDFLILCVLWRHADVCDTVQQHLV